MFSVLLIILGSTRFPMSIATDPIPKKIIKKGINSPNWISENKVGSSVPIIGPIDGMKLSMKIKNAQNNGDSMPTAKRMK